MLRGENVNTSGLSSDKEGPLIHSTLKSVLKFLTLQKTSFGYPRKLPPTSLRQAYLLGLSHSAIDCLKSATLPEEIWQLHVIQLPGPLDLPLSLATVLQLRKSRDGVGLKLRPRSLLHGVQSTIQQKETCWVSRIKGHEKLEGISRGHLAHLLHCRHQRKRPRLTYRLGV